MNSAVSHSPPMPRETGEPAAENRPVPVWLMVLLFALLYWGMVFFDRYGGWFDAQVYAPYTSLADLQTFEPRGGGFSAEHFRTIYGANCGLCHGDDGKGKPNQAPPYVGSDWVTGSPNRMIRIPLSGLTGPVQVNGTEYNLPSMAAMGAGLSDEDLAGVLTYIRLTFGNKASPITPEQVKKVRAEIGAHAAWTAQELQAVE